MHTQTAELLSAAQAIAPAAEALRVAFHAIAKNVEGPVATVSREAEEALVDETDRTLRAHLDGRVCQRARAASTHLLAARRELASAVAALTELATDLDALRDAAAEGAGA